MLLEFLVTFVTFIMSFLFLKIVFVNFWLYWVFVSAWVFLWLWQAGAIFIVVCKGLIDVALLATDHRL